MVRGLLGAEDFPSHKHPILHNLTKKKKKLICLNTCSFFPSPYPTCYFFLHLEKHSPRSFLTWRCPTASLLRRCTSLLGPQQLWGKTDGSKLQTSTTGLMPVEIRAMEDSAKKLYDRQLLDTFACSLHLGCPLGSPELLKHGLQGWLHLWGSPSLGTHRIQES